MCDPSIHIHCPGFPEPIISNVRQPSCAHINVNTYYYVAKPVFLKIQAKNRNIFFLANQNRVPDASVHPIFLQFLPGLRIDSTMGRFRNLISLTYAQKLSLVAAIPLIVAVAAIALMVAYESRATAKSEIQALERRLIAARKTNCAIT